MMSKKKKRPVYDYIEQEKILNKPWLSTEDLKIILPIGENAINKFRKSICEEMDKNNEFYFKTRPILIPTKKVLQLLRKQLPLLLLEKKLVLKN